MVVHEKTGIIPKKRGRKPRGGKIITERITHNVVLQAKQNIILHLKCSLNDLESTDSIVHEIESFQFEQYKRAKTNNVSNIQTDEGQPKTQTSTSPTAEICNESIQVLDRTSACFWCTYDFDNTAIYIPKYKLKDTYHCYGCFCSPECATAYLFNEPNDSTTKFERYHLLNNLYGGDSKFSNNVKPAPNPYYTLDKFYGNQSIQEYRSLLKSKRLLLVIDKPLVRILPEIHEDNEEFILNNTSIPSSLKIKKNQSISRCNILKKNFGL